MSPGPPSPRRGLVPSLQSSRTSRRPSRLETLLADLGPGLRRGGTLPSPAGSSDPARRRPSGLAAIDDLIGGGFPADRLSEITGPVSSGRTSVALALLAHTTGWCGEIAALVDLADAFDPVSAESAGVDLDRILWVRAGGWREALRAAERLLETGGIPVVVLDLSQPDPVTARRPDPSAADAAIPASAWTRLARLAASTRTALVVLSSRRLTGSPAGLVLEMRPPRPRFTGSPPLLEAIDLQAVLVRQRGGPVHHDDPEEETEQPIRSGVVG
jgi:hypothetical protein